MGTHKTKTTEPLDLIDYERSLPDAPDQFTNYAFVKGLTLARAKEIWRDFSDKWNQATIDEVISGSNFQRGARLERPEDRIAENFETLCRSSGRVKPKPAARVAGKNKEQNMEASSTEIFNKLVLKRQADHGEPRHVAHMAVCRQYPEIRQQYVEEYNNAARVRRAS